MKEWLLKYGCNPNQVPARIYHERELPLEVLSGNPGYINFLDALNAWQLVRELKTATGLPAAASFKHVSPAGAAVGLPLSEEEKAAFFVADGQALTPQAAAYARARGTDRVSSFGDFIALSDICDESTARLIRHEVSDGIIAPGYDPDAMKLLLEKKKGQYIIIQIDPAYQPPATERREVFGITFEQGRNNLVIDERLLEQVVTEKQTIPPDAKRDLLLSLITLKYTQSNSVCYAKGGQTTGVGAGQQSRILCTRLAGDKSDLFWLRQSERVLRLPFLRDLPRPARDNVIDGYIRDSAALLESGEWQAYFSEKPAPFTAEEKQDSIKKIGGVSLGSDAFFPFSDNLVRAAESGVSYVVQAGGSLRDREVIAMANELSMTMAFCGVRLFHH